jgi:hypothetical protein
MCVDKGWYGIFLKKTYQVQTCKLSIKTTRCSSKRNVCSYFAHKRPPPTSPLKFCDNPLPLDEHLLVLIESFQVCTLHLIYSLFKILL